MHASQASPAARVSTESILPSRGNIHELALQATLVTLGFGINVRRFFRRLSLQESTGPYAWAAPLDGYQ